MNDSSPRFVRRSIELARDATARGLADRFAGSVMYASGEPCPMCAAACVWAGTARIVFAASTEGFTRILTDGPHFRLTCAELIETSDAEMVIVGPTNEQEALSAMRAAIASA